MTLEQAKQYLSELGLSLPDLVIQAILDTIEEHKDCLEANYPPSVIVLLYCYIFSLMAVAQGARFVSSQSLPGGLSRSFTYKTGIDLWNGQLNLLRLYDKKKCLESLIPDNPYKTKKARLTTVSGGCYE